MRCFINVMLISINTVFVMISKAYHAQKSQNWGSQSPILLSGNVSGVKDGDGAYRFDSFSGEYVKIANQDISSNVHSSALPPVEVGVPTYTFIGTLGADVSACQTYPPIVGSSGNTFIFPDPLNPYLGPYFEGARYVFEVAYNDSTIDRSLIAVADLSNSTSTAYYSFTVAMVCQNYRKAISNSKVNIVIIYLHVR